MALESGSTLLNTMKHTIVLASNVGRLALLQAAHLPLLKRIEKSSLGNSLAPLPNFLFTTHKRAWKVTIWWLSKGLEKPSDS